MGALIGEAGVGSVSSSGVETFVFAAISDGAQGLAVSDDLGSSES